MKKRKIVQRLKDLSELNGSCLSFFKDVEESEGSNDYRRGQIDARTDLRWRIEDILKDI